LGSLNGRLKDPTISVATNDVSFGYIVKYAGNSASDERLPMLVALHGNGDTAENFYRNTLDQLNVSARIILLKGPISMGNGGAWPWTATDFSYYGKALSEAVELLASNYPTAGKPVLLGFSGGGMMAYYQAIKHGDLYASIFPVSGKFSAALLGDEPARPGAKVYGFHGTGDRVVAISGGRNAVKVLRAKGIKVKFTEFDGGHHGIATNMKSKITQAIEQKLKIVNYNAGQ